MDDLSSRIKRVLVSPKLIHEWLVQGCKLPARSIEVLEGVPEDAVFLAGYYDVPSRCFCFVYCHPSWNIVEDGHDAPILQVVVHATEEGQ